jgi:hypothetical protein
MNLSFGFVWARFYLLDFAQCDPVDCQRQVRVDNLIDQDCRRQRQVVDVRMAAARTQPRADQKRRLGLDHPAAPLNATPALVAQLAEGSTI